MFHCCEDGNYLQIVQLNEESGSLELVTMAEHSFPATKVMFLPEEVDDENWDKLRSLHIIATQVQ
eukprot:6296311-Amphidinium_carterae.1